MGRRKQMARCMVPCSQLMSVCNIGGAGLTAWRPEHGVLLMQQVLWGVRQHIIIAL